MSGGSSGGGSQLDPEMRDAFLNNRNRATGVAENLGARQFADYNPAQRAGFARLTASTGFNGTPAIGTGAVGQAVDMAGSAGQYRPGQVSSDVIAPRSFLQADIGAYMNPYQQEVIDRTMADINRSRQIAGASDAAKAIGQKAFGGSRAAVVEAETAGNYDRNLGDQIANLRMQGFNTAANLATGDITRDLQAAQANQQSRLNAAQSNQQAGLTGNQQSLAAAESLRASGVTQQQMEASNIDQLMKYAGIDQARSQEILDSIRNLPLEQQQIINQALGLNVGGGSGMQSSQESRQGLLGLLGL
jgi:hypothetical protein